MLRILLSTYAFNKPKSDRCLITLVLLSIALVFNFNTKNIESFFSIDGGFWAFCNFGYYSDNLHSKNSWK